MQKKKGSNLIFVLLSIIIIVLIFLAVNIVRLFNKPIETTLVKNGELIKYEEVTGYIIRDEKEYWQIYEYIENNSLKWQFDEYYE